MFYSKIKIRQKIRESLQKIQKFQFMKKSWKHVLFIIDLLGKLCTPERDQEVANLRTHLDDLVQLFKEIMKVLDHMKFDMVAEPGSSKDHQKPGSGLRKEQKPVQCNWNSKSDKSQEVKNWEL